MTRILTLALNPAIDISSEADEVRHTHKTRTHDQSQHAGGGGINVARVIVELGGTCELLYLSGGATGTLLEAMLQPLGIVKHVIPITDPVRVAYNVRERSTGLEYRFVPEGPMVTAEEIAPVFSVIDAAGADYVVASGSLPRGLADDTYARLAERTVAQGGRFVLDTSGPALVKTLERTKAFLIKPSLGELETLAGTSLDRDSAGAAAQALVRRGVADHIAVTLGADGAILAGADRVLRLPAVEIDVKSAVGAGDSFLAGMVWSLSQGHQIEEAFRLGIAAGAATAMTSGTQLCHRADVARLFQQIRDRAAT